MTAAKKEEKVEDVEMKDAEEEKAGKIAFQQLFLNFFYPFRHNL